MIKLKLAKRSLGKFLGLSMKSFIKGKQMIMGKMFQLKVFSKIPMKKNKSQRKFKPIVKKKFPRKPTFQKTKIQKQKLLKRKAKKSYLKGLTYFQNRADTSLSMERRNFM